MAESSTSSVNANNTIKYGLTISIFVQTKKDRYIRINDNIGKVLNSLVTDDDLYIVYRTFRNASSYFDTPLNYELLGIHLASDLQHHSIVYTLEYEGQMCIAALFREYW